MTRPVFWILWLALVAAAAAAFGWHSRFHLVIGAFLSLPLFTLWWVTRRSRRAAAGSRIRPAWLAVLAMLAVGYLAIGFEAAKWSPLRNLMSDYDRDELLTQIGTSVARRDFPAASTLIQHRLKVDDTANWPMLSPQFRGELIRRRYELLIESGQHSATSREAADLYQAAIRWASEQGLNSEHARALEKLAAQNIELDDFITRCRAEKNWLPAAENLRAVLRSKTNGASRIRAMQLCDVLVEWAQATPGLAPRRVYLTEAQEVDREFDLQHRSITTLLAEVDRQLSERGNLDEEIAKLKMQGDWDALRALLSWLIKQRPREEWTQSYDQLYLDSLLTQAASATDEQCATLLDAADTFATDRGLPNDLVRARRDAFERGRSASNELAARERRQDRSIAEFIDNLRKSGVDAGLTHAFEVLIDIVPRDRWPQPFEQVLPKILIDHCDRSGDAVAVRDRAAQALEIAIRCQLDQQPFAARLDRAEAILANDRKLRTPVALAQGTTATIQRVDLSDFPFVTIEVTVSHNQQHVKGLSAKDVRLTIGDAEQVSLLVAPVEGNERLCIVLALDTSPSMAGAPQQALAMGVARAFERWEGRNDIDVLIGSASDPGRVLHNWMRPASTTSVDFTNVELKNNTALLAATYDLLARLAGKGGRRRLVLVSDGGNNLPGPTIEAIIARAIELGAVIDTVGIRSTALDAIALRRLATETGGAYVEAARPTEIADRFATITGRINREYYRLMTAVDPAMFRSSPTGAWLSVKVGGERSVTAASFISPPSTVESQVVSKN